MGIDAVNLALTHIRDLTFGEAKVLLVMATSSLDKPNGKGQPPGLYWKGEVPFLAVMYGPRGDDAYTSTQVRYVRQMVAGLRKKGLIQPVGRAHTGSRQTWRLTYFVGAVPVDDQDGEGGEGVESSVPDCRENHTQSDGEGVESSAEIAEKTTPLGHTRTKGTPQDLTEDEHDDSQPSRTYARARAVDQSGVGVGGDGLVLEFTSPDVSRSAAREAIAAAQRAAHG